MGSNLALVLIQIKPLDLPIALFSLHTGMLRHKAPANNAILECLLSLLSLVIVQLHISQFLLLHNLPIASGDGKPELFNSI